MPIGLCYNANRGSIALRKQKRYRIMTNQEKMTIKELTLILQVALQEDLIADFTCAEGELEVKLTNEQKFKITIEEL